jgi:hypothetical protein
MKDQKELKIFCQTPRTYEFKYRVYNRNETLATFVEQKICYVNCKSTSLRSI